MGTNGFIGMIRHLRRVALRRDGAGLTDGDLLELYVSRRDEAAFDALVHRHGAMVLGVCRRILRNEADAEDAFQATFLVFVRKAALIRSQNAVSNWLYGVAHNTAMKAKAMNRKRYVKERQAGTVPKHEARAEVWQELQAVFDAELSRLPDKYRIPIVLCDLEGKTIKEVARCLGWPQGTVATRLTRGRAQLAKRLTKRGLSLSGGVIAAVLSQAAASAQGTASACVPASLAVSTVEAATAVAAGHAAAAAVVSTKVAALTERVVKAMLMTKLKALAAMLLAGTVLGMGGGLFTYHILGAELRGGQSPTVAADDEKAKDKKAKSDKEAIQGTWVAVSGEQNGEKVPKEKLEAIKLIFTEDKVTREGYEPAEGTYSIDPDKKPKEIDLFADAAKPWKGIYELKETTLKLICKREDRPTDFDSNGGRFLLVFEKN
jgi:RNA polymerase sigma factor (sigma-70 family)